MSLRRGIETLLKLPDPPSELVASLRLLEQQAASLQKAAADLARELHALRKREEERGGA